MTVRGFNRRPVKHEDEQKTSNYTRHRAVLANPHSMKSSGYHSKAYATFRALMLMVANEECQRCHVPFLRH
jgi:hypothetical protein